ncbi:MAG TPA: baseplate J/gp47 family protein, partial [Kofleriaceae bacterium]|nr:baseplate J/gp47 family protein [Kofleriaceae bacterium]
DPYLDHAAFSFKARCPSTLDCEAPPVVCPPEPTSAPPIDYLAKDFASFKNALSDFSALRYPAWQERSEADFGVMFMEALASVADDLSYQQDRIAAESYLDTATERRSLVRHARLVDYEPRPATAARVILQFTVTSGPIAPGIPVSALGPDGAPIPFETGTGLADRTLYPASPRWNAIAPYWWDDASRCLARGATEMWVEDPSLDLALSPGIALLIDTTPEDPGHPSVRQIVTLTAVSPAFDPVFGKQLVHLQWGAGDALGHERDLTRTQVKGNLVPATQGRRHVESFATGPVAARLPRAIVRTGPNGTAQYLYTLANAPLAWLAPAAGPGAGRSGLAGLTGLTDPAGSPRPELRLTRQDDLAPWTWVRLLLDAGPFDAVVTIDPVRYRPTGDRRDDGTTPMDYDGAGDTLRFGDGTFGAIPESPSTFEVVYRAGGGALGNVAADSITQILPGSPLAGMVTAVNNPFPATGGADEESPETVRRLAPEAFAARQFRAVRAEDYATAAEDLPWVQRAGTTFRYTGSWLTVFTAADPVAAEAMTDGQQRELIDRLDRYRMAGYESYVLAPRFASLDLQISVCARADAFAGDVEEQILRALSTEQLPDGTRGFFHPDRFTFGGALERSALEAAIQRAAGVDGVRSIAYRRRGVTSGFVAMPDRVAVAIGEIIRADNDPSRPAAGSIRVDVQGGK